MSDGSADVDFILHAVEGDQHALSRLLVSEHDALLGYIDRNFSKQFQSVVSAEDILQDTFSDAFRYIGRFTPSTTAAFAAWLRTIADNRIRNTIRDLKTAKRGGRQPRPTIESGDAACDSQPTPGRSMERKEAEYAVHVNVDGLPSDQRNVLRLRYFEGKSLEETAQQMQRTSGAVRGLLHRAKVALRSALGRSSKWFHSK